ncbi:MAG TPA: ABC transporter substrate-binding protein [Streptosporangiaceae bacterium]|nr:ABC transporter substrate-binding protein [Streptosporangiaceae bacterium]
MIKVLPTHRQFAVLAAAALLSAGVAACSSSGTSSSGSKSAGTGTLPTLVMESSPEPTITQDFNPYVNTGAIYNMGATGLIYEPLTEFDLANPSVQYPWLATSYSWSNGGKAITFNLRSGVKWNNGQPLTAADVAFTFNLIKQYADINLGGLTISSVTTSGSAVTVNFPTAQYAHLEQIAGTAILPQSQWSSVGDPAKYTDANPIGTGPYVLQTYTPQGVTLKKNPYYWQNVPVPKVYFPNYSSNTSALTALFSNQIDWTGNFIPGLQKSFIDTDPVNHHQWQAPGASNALMPNLTKWPTNQLPVRKAISDAIDRTVIANEGEDGEEAPVANATGLTMPPFTSWGGPVQSMTQAVTANATAAAQDLERAGYKKDGAGYYALNGKEVALTIVDPSQYTDYAADDALVAQELKAAGINATFNGVSVDAWNADVADGNFQLTMHWGNGGISPYEMYDNWLDSTLSTGAAASAATGDYERLNDPTVDAELAKLAGDQTIAQQAQDLVPLEQYVAQNLPVIPTVSSSDWFEYNSKNWSGWPTQQNPYDSGQPSGTNNGPGTGSNLVVILHLHPTK